MTEADPVYWFPVWAGTLIVLAGMLGAMEAGYRAGRFHRKKKGGAGGAEFGVVQGGVLGILGLLLAFTYSDAASGAASRQASIVEEADAIGTAYLHAGLAPEPVRGELRRALREYLATRSFPDEALSDRERFQETVAQSDRAQARLWPIASKLTEGRTPTAIDVTILQSVTRVIAANVKRIEAFGDHVPDVVLLTILLVCMIALGLVGFAGGAAGSRNLFFTTALAVLLVLVVWLIVDLDHPGEGFIRTNRQSLDHLARSLETGAYDTLAPSGG